MAAALLVSCGEASSRSKESAPQPAQRPAQRPAQSSPRAPSAPPSVRDAVETKVSRVTVSDGRPRPATLTIPALGLHDLAVVPYRGRTDDAHGTLIQDGGAAASPFGAHGGVGPGGLGNYQITAAVPGRPGAPPRRAFLTLSTCATWEDHAAGNYWVDELHNPEHRLDKIGVLVRTVSI
jgi:sortase A